MAPAKRGGAKKKKPKPTAKAAGVKKKTPSPKKAGKAKKAATKEAATPKEDVATADQADEVQKEPKENAEATEGDKKEETGETAVGPEPEAAEGPEKDTAGAGPEEETQETKKKGGKKRASPGGKKKRASPGGKRGRSPGGKKAGSPGGKGKSPGGKKGKSPSGKKGKSPGRKKGKSKPKTPRELERLRKEKEQQEKERAKLEAVESERRAKEFAAEGGKRVEQLKESAEVLNQYEKIIQVHVKKLKELLEWEFYIACGDTPDISDLIAVNSYMTEWIQELQEPDLAAVFKYVPGVLEVVEKLKAFLEIPPENIKMDTLYELGLMYQEFQEKHQDYIDQGTFHLVEDLHEHYDPLLGVFEHIVQNPEQNITHALWGNLYGMPGHTEHEYTGEGFAFKIPESISLNKSVFRLLRTNYNHFSDKSNSHYAPGVDNSLKQSIENWEKKKVEHIKHLAELASPEDRSKEKRRRRKKKDKGKKKKRGKSKKGKKKKGKKGKGKKRKKGGGDGSTTEYDTDDDDDLSSESGTTISTVDDSDADELGPEGKKGGGKKKKKGKGKGKRKGRSRSKKKGKKKKLDGESESDTEATTDTDGEGKKGKKKKRKKGGRSRTRSSDSTDSSSDEETSQPGSKGRKAKKKGKGKSRDASRAKSKASSKRGGQTTTTTEGETDDETPGSQSEKGKKGKKKKKKKKKSKKRRKGKKSRSRSKKKKKRKKGKGKKSRKKGGTGSGTSGSSTERTNKSGNTTTTDFDTEEEEEEADESGFGETEEEEESQEMDIEDETEDDAGGTGKRKKKRTKKKSREGKKGKKAKSGDDTDDMEVTKGKGGAKAKAGIKDKKATRDQTAKEEKAEKEKEKAKPKSKSRSRSKDKAKGKTKPKKQKSKSRDTSKSSGKSSKSSSKTRSKSRGRSRTPKKDKGKKKVGKSKSRSGSKKGKKGSKSRSRSKKGKKGGKSRSRSKKGKKKGKKGKKDKKSKSRDRKEKALLEQAKAAEKLEKSFFLTKTLDEELNLRQYSVNGGLYNFRMLHVPPQPVNRGEWTMHIIEFPRAMTEVPFEEEFAEPPPADLETEWAQSEEGLEIAAKEEEFQKLVALGVELPAILLSEHQETLRLNAEKKKQFEHKLKDLWEERRGKTLERIVSITVKLPEQAIWFEEPVPVVWNPELRIWSNSPIHDVKFDAENTSVQFFSNSFGVIGFAANRWVNMPYKHWDLRSPEEGIVKFTVQAKLITLEFTVEDDLVCVSAIEDAPPHSPKLEEKLLNVNMKPGALIKTLRECGLDLFPDFDSYAYMDGILIKPTDVEDHLYQCMAIIASAYNFSWSKWNRSVAVSRDRIALQMQPKEGGEPGVVLSTSHMSTFVNCTEESKTFSEERREDMVFTADLLTLATLIGGPDIENLLRVSNTSPLPPHADAVRLLLQAVRPLSFSE